MITLWKALKTGLTLLALGAFAAPAALGHGNAVGDAKATIGNANVSIHYGRPMLHGRDMLKKISPGNLWRLGADFPTTVESDRDLDFGGTRVPKGKYVLLARLVGPGKWTLIVSSKPIREFQPSAKIAEVPLELETADASVDELTIQVASRDGAGVIEISWGTQRLDATFKAAD